jgi:hypothetical protein
MRKIIITALMLAVLCGCEQSEKNLILDYRARERQRVFTDCLKNTPQGPVSVHNSNDWSEVIDSCDSAAYYQTNALIPQQEGE